MHTFARKPNGSQQREDAKSTKIGRAPFGQSRDVLSIGQFQRTISNQALHQLLKSQANSLEAGSSGIASTGIVHDFSRKQFHSNTSANAMPKLMVSGPGDVYEQEADRVADEVMRMPDSSLTGAAPNQDGAYDTRERASSALPSLQRTCTECATEEEEILQTKSFENSIQRQMEEEEELLQTKIDTGTIPEIEPEIAARIDSLRGGGKELPAAERGYFEPRFGHDFSRVRVHSDVRTSEVARAVNARAFTVGRDIVFGAGQYVQGTTARRKLLAHELTHTIQQGAAANIQAPGKLSGINASLPVRKASLQRVADKSNMPAISSCDHQDPTPGRPIGTNIMFGQGDQALDDLDETLIEAEYESWNARGRTDRITVHGFASSEGPPGLNWQISCNRALAVKAEFVRLAVPNPLVTTVPNPLVTTIAHGETEEYSATDLPPNRRAVIRFVPTTPLTTAGDCPTTIRENTTLTSGCSNGIVIAADNVILDCAGHTLTGTGGGNGVELTGRTGVRVVNCHVTSFWNGFALRQLPTPGTPRPPRGTPRPGTKSSNNTFTNNTAFRNGADGFDLNDSPNNTFIQNVANDNPDHGFELDFSGENLLVGNTANRNGDGFDVCGIDRPDAAPSPNNTFVNNRADSNRESGFRISSDGNTLRGNTANNSVGVPDRRPGRTGTRRRGDGFRIEGNNNTLSGNSGSGNRDDLDVRNNTSGNTCSGNSFGTTNGQCPPDFP